MQNGPDGAVIMSSTNGLVGTGFAGSHLGTGSNPERGFKGGIAPNQVIARSELEVHREMFTE